MNKTIGLVGQTVIFHMAMAQQAIAGGNHAPQLTKPVLFAPAIVVGDRFPNEERPHPVNLRVLCDSRDTIWVTEANHGSGPGQWEFPDEVKDVEAKDNQPLLKKVSEEAGEALSPIKTPDAKSGDVLTQDSETESHV